MSTQKEDIKAFSIRMPRKLWISIKREAAQKEISMTDLIIESIIYYRKEKKKALTVKDTVV